MLRSVFALLICFGISACGQMAASDRVQIPTPATPGQTGSGPVLPATLYKPPGPGPFPAMVVLHPCNGVNKGVVDRAKWLMAMGYLAIVPDSFGPRGIANVCGNGAVTPKQRVPDAEAAARYLKTLPDVRGDRIGVIGFSHGAVTAIQLAQSPASASLFHVAVAYYGACYSNTSFVGMPTLILAGANDDWTPAAPCEAWAARVGDPDKLNVTIYPGAYHAFDRPGSAMVQGGGGVMHRVQYDANATTDADARTVAFLARWLKP